MDSILVFDDFKQFIINKYNKEGNLYGFNISF